MNDDEMLERQALFERNALDRAKSRKPRADEFGAWLFDGCFINLRGEHVESGYPSRAQEKESPAANLSHSPQAGNAIQAAKQANPETVLSEGNRQAKTSEDDCI
jgi:hypothetical protein